MINENNKGIAIKPVKLNDYYNYEDMQEQLIKIELKVIVTHGRVIKLYM
jgi:hypothetical protein